MTTTPNLLIDHIAASQAQKEVTANTAFDALDKALCQPTSIALADADLALTDAQMLGSLSLVFTGTLTASRTITFPAHAKLILAENATTGGFEMALTTPSGTAIPLAAGARKLLYCNGTTLKPIAEYSSAGSGPYDLGGSFSGKPSDGAVLLRYPMPRAVRFPAGLSGSKGMAAVAATTSATFALKKNGTQFGMFMFAASSTSATFAAASATDFAAGDVMTLTAPTTADATLADIGFALAGVRL